MKAVVLVGGEGTRLRPLTERTPKPLLPFMNRPFLHHVLDLLARHGVDEVVLSSPYLEEEFRSFLGERAGKPAVAWITEEVPLGTCGAIVGARDLLDDAFLVCNGDILTDLDMASLVRFHREREAVATITLTRVDDARPYGLVEAESDGRVLAFREKPKRRMAGMINAGTYVLEPRALDGVPRGVPVSIERETFPHLIESGEPVYSFASEAYWRDLGTPAAYLEAHMDALEGRVASMRPPRPLIAPDAHVDPDARVGPLVVVGGGVRLAAGAVVERSVLHRGAVVEKNAEVEGSIAGPGSRVETGALVHDAVLADGARVAPGARVDGELAGPGVGLE